MKEFGNEKSLYILIEKLIELEEKGIDFQLDNDNINVKFVLGLILGDNLGLNSILDMKKSFSANSFCRFCTVLKNETQTLNSEK